ncbi:hypothetical protein N9176_00485 [bacterium]|nr:hypothetical protein [bacterium]
MSFINEIEYYVYDEYIELGKEAYHEKIHYFEAHQLHILNLPLNQSIELQCDYIEALHQTNRYFKVLNKVDDLIGAIIYENVYHIKGTDVYKSMLFIKADSLYNTIDYKKANHVISELIKIDGNNSLCKTLFVKNNVDNLRYEGQKVHAVGILLFLTSAFVIGTEILMIRSFYNEWIDIFVAIRNILFLCGVVLIVGQEINIRMKSLKAYNQLIK